MPRKNKTATAEYYREYYKRPDRKAYVRRKVADAYSIIKIELEIEKCDVLCSNCHRKAHYETEEKED